MIFQKLELLYEGPLEIGGHTVHTEIPQDFVGPCNVVSGNGSDELIGSFTSWDLAKLAAIYATTPDGGYGSTIIRACSAA